MVQQRRILINGIKLIEYDINCPLCGSKMVLKKSGYGYFYGCTEYTQTGCKSTIGAKRNGTPVKIPESFQEKEAKLQAKKQLELLSNSGKIEKRQILTWICEVLQCSRKDAHVAKFSIQQCNTLIQSIKAKLNEAAN